jgi:hypothetical protein
MAPSDPANLITVPRVANTPSGADELEAFRRQQLVNTAIAWAVPVISLAATLLFDGLGLGAATGLAALALALSGGAAPGLTFVYWMRRRKALWISECMPQLPRARLRLGSGRRQDE